MFDEYLNSIGEYGTVTQLQHPLITIRGLPHAHPNEMLIFEEGQIGQVFDIDHNSLHALIYSQKPISLQTKVTRTNLTMAIPVSGNLLGKVIDPLTNVIASSPVKSNPSLKSEMRQLFVSAPGIASRTPIKEQLVTGVTKVDLLIPLGKGQRELIMGDVKTGKTMFLLRTLVNQIKNQGCVVVYAAIGKKITEIINLQEFFQKEGIADKVILVATSAADIASSVFLSPYTAMTIAEYFRDQGMNVLVVMDDMTTHAQRYREIALKSKRFPGRESYPGDIFYTHAGLLERAGNYTHKKGTVSITCLPIVMTTEGDITGYIGTNLMSMTDGHIFFDSGIYNKGERPAINIPLSVTRVGRQTQSSLAQEINKTILSAMSEYNKISNISYLGSELSDVSKSILKRGESLMNVLDQDMTIQMPYEIQILLIGLVWSNSLDLSGDIKYTTLLPKLMTIFQQPKLLAELQELMKVKTLKEFTEGLKQNQQLLDLCKTEKS